MQPGRCLIMQASFQPSTSMHEEGPIPMSEEGPITMTLRLCLNPLLPDPPRGRVIRILIQPCAGSAPD